MATTGGIKGGQAYVQAFLDDNPVTQGLAKLRGKIRGWQASLSNLAAGTMGGNLPEPLAAIARFAMSPAGAFSGLLAAAHHTAAAREEMLRMSETTGVTVDKLSAANYAASKYGVSLESLASGLRKMNSKEFAAGLGGGKGGMKGFARGLFAGQDGDAIDNMLALAQKMQGQTAQVQAGMARAAGMTELLPMLAQGADALKADIEHAKQLGLVLSEADAKGAQRFGFAMTDLQKVMDSAIGQIGGALVPIITGFTNIVVKVVTTVRDWIKQHQALTQGIFFATGAIVAGGIAIKLLSLGMGLLGSVLTVILAPAYAIATVAAAIFNAVCAANPIGLIVIAIVAFGAALAALAGYLIWNSGILGDFGKMFGKIGSDAADAMGAISNAIAGGEIEKAWKVVTTFIQYEWANVLTQCTGMWDAFANSILTNPLINPLGIGGKSDLELAHEENRQINEQGDRIAKLKKDYQDAKAAANAVKPFDYSKSGGGAAAAMQAGEVRGTFSGAVAGMLGGGNGILQQMYDDDREWRKENYAQGEKQIALLSGVV